MNVDIEIKYHYINDLLKSTIYLYTVDNDIMIAKFKIIKELGRGTIGTVFLLEKTKTNKKILFPIFNEDYYVIKIANEDCYDDFQDEINGTIALFKKNNISYRYNPIVYGNIGDIENCMCCIFPFVGSYNLEKSLKKKLIKDNNIKMKILTEIIQDLRKFKNIIHGDLKSANIVLENSTPTIIDFGLIRSTMDPGQIISTVYCTSPESLFTNNYNNILIKDEIKQIDFSKHDYFGLFVIIIDIFIRHGFWSNFCTYTASKLGISYDILSQHKSSDIYVYIWYQFNKMQPLEGIWKRLIEEIEKRNPILSRLKTSSQFLEFNDFFDIYLKPSMYLEKTSNIDSITTIMKAVLSSLILINPYNRPSYDIILESIIRIHF
jgi:serine/threonine protein kinase